jgi:hypothetical protein
VGILVAVIDPEGDHVRLYSRGHCQGGEGVHAREVKFKIKLLVSVRGVLSNSAKRCCTYKRRFIR